MNFRRCCASSRSASSALSMTEHGQPLQCKKPRHRCRGFVVCVASRLVALRAEELQQEHEHVDEVEIERESAHHRLLASGGNAVAFIVHALDALRVIGGETRKDQYAKHRDRK